MKTGRYKKWFPHIMKETSKGNEIMFGEKMKAEAIRIELLALDEACQDKEVKATFIVVGGAAGELLFNYYDKTFRATRDIDIGGLEVSNDQAFQTLLKDFYIEEVDGHLTPDVHEMKEIDEIFQYDEEFTNIEVWVPTIEIWVCLKALTNRQKDLEDIRDTGILEVCDASKTISFIEEYKGYLATDNPLNNHYDEILKLLHERL